MAREDDTIEKRKNLFDFDCISHLLDRLKPQKLLLIVEYLIVKKLRDKRFNNFLIGQEHN